MAAFSLCLSLIREKKQTISIAGENVVFDMQFQHNLLVFSTLKQIFDKKRSSLFKYYHNDIHGSHTLIKSVTTEFSHTVFLLAGIHHN